MRPKVIPDHLSILHHEADALEFGNADDRISSNGNEIRNLNSEEFSVSQMFGSSGFPVGQGPEVTALFCRECRTRNYAPAMPSRTRLTSTLSGDGSTGL